MKILVITGGIGSGKSVACSILEEKFGWKVYAADTKVKQLYMSHPTLLSEIERDMGMSLRNTQGDFIPHYLAERIFSDREALEKVESRVFPVLMEDFEKWKADNSHCDVLILESATILEKPQLAALGDYKVIIDAPFELRMKRASERDGVTVEKVRMRGRNQTLMNEVSRGVRADMADEVIVNDGDMAEFEEKLLDLRKKLL